MHILQASLHIVIARAHQNFQDMELKGIRTLLDKGCIATVPASYETIHITADMFILRQQWCSL